MSKTSFDYIWELLNPQGEYRRRCDTCRAYWNALTLNRQRLIYRTLREQKKNGDPINDNPLFAIMDCDPKPKDYNGSPLLDEVRDKTRIACYNGHWGIYTLEDIKLFEMQTRE